MKKDDEILLEWYEEFKSAVTPVNQEAGNQQAQDSNNIETIVVTTKEEPQESEESEEKETPEPSNNDDSVILKDSQTSFKAYLYAKKVQELLTQFSVIDDPYQSNTMKREEIVSMLKNIQTKLGEEIAKL